jgi:CheY-like chemotaxis protein
MRATFETLPEYDPAAEAPPPRVPAPAPAREPGRARVLVAEDDPAMRELVTGTLEGAGFQVVEAVDGLAFVTRFSQLIFSEWPEGPIDLIVSDLRMPTYNGLDVVAALREAGVRIPVVLMTAFPCEDTRERARHVGAVLFDKPFDLDELRGCVTRLLHAAPRPSLARPPAPPARGRPRRRRPGGAVAPSPLRGVTRRASRRGRERATASYPTFWKRTVGVTAYGRRRCGGVETAGVAARAGSVWWRASSGVRARGSPRASPVTMASAEPLREGQNGPF